MASNRKWLVRGYYSDDAEPPKIPRTLAFEVRHKYDWFKDMEVEAAEGRNDIGRVEVIPLTVTIPPRYPSRFP